MSEEIREVVDSNSVVVVEWACAVDDALPSDRLVIKITAISEEERQKRLRAVLRALTLTFLHPGGAMRNTQSPHLTDFQGVITTSDHSVPAPTVSALNDDFTAQVKGIAAALEKMSGKVVGVHDFGSLAQFAEKMSDITV